ncbi:FAR1-related sequence 5-like protein [Tanacetum coccineum]
MTNTPTSSLPQATTTKLPPATFTTTNLPPAPTSTTTSHLPPATSSTSHLLPSTSTARACNINEHMSTSTARACNINEADLFVVPVVGEENLLIEAEIEELDDVTMNEDVEANVILQPVKINTPRPSLYLHNETPGGTTYWEPNVDEPYLPLEGKRFDTIEECVEFYSVYAENGGFEVKKSAQKKTKSGMVRSKYVMCNREGVPKEININTLDPQNNDKQVRNTRYRITGCMARIKVDLDHVSGKYEITKFVAKHNHQLLPKEYKHLTKKQRKMPQAEKMFVVRASTMRLGATKAHNLYCKMKGGTQYVHGTSDDFKNHIRDVNAFIGESDAQMLINKMENRKKFVPNFTFHYLVENSELVAMFWADEVAKCNYKEFGDIISFDATFRTNKQKQVSKGEKDEQSYDDADDSDNRLEPGSHKENPEYVDDDDDKEEDKVDAKEGNEMGSLEIRTEKMQTPIPTTPRSPRINLSSDKNIVQELMDIVSLSTPTTSKDPYKQRRISKKYSQLPVDQVLQEIIPQLAEKATDDLIENNLKPCIAETIIEDHDAFRSERKFKKSSTSNTSCGDDAFHSQHHDDHEEDDAPP